MSNTTGTISSISELLSLSNSQYRIYDMGRRVDKISKAQFEKIESAQLPYPYPSQGHAFLAIAFWQKQSTTPYLWFVKLPLDERGLLNQGARNHFIAIIIEALGGDLSVNPTEQQEALLKKNPYHFTPAQYKLAAINSIVSVALKQDASKFYQPALQYLSGNTNWQAWQDIGVQGLSDFAVRLAENNNEELLINAIKHLPEQVLSPLCLALENVTLSAELIEKIVTLYQQANKEGNNALALSILRALASSTEHPFSENFIVGLIKNETLSEEILIIIAGRLWPALANESVLFSYLEHLVKSDDLTLFMDIFKDLVAIPSMRPLLLQAIRSPNRSNSLATAIGKLFQQ